MSEVTVPYLQQKYLITQAANKYHVPFGIMAGVYGIETDFGKNVAVSSAGAIGPFQFLPSTAQQYSYPQTNNPNAQQFGQQADATAHYLSDLFRQHGNWDAALRAYSGGGYGYKQVSAKAATLNISDPWSGGGVPANNLILGGAIAGAGAIVGLAGAGAEEAGAVTAAESSAASGAATGATALDLAGKLSRIKQGLGVAALISVLLDPKHWLRFLMVIGGAVIILVAIIYMAKAQLAKAG